MFHLRIATCRPLPEPDPDEELLLNALDTMGIAAEMVPWHEPSLWQPERVGGHSPVLIRSTWDYIHRLPAFEAWLQQVTKWAPIWNPWSIVRDNLHKKYLLALAASGVPTTPTEWVTQGDTTSLRERLDRNEWTDVVIKPAVSAGSFDTYRITVCDADAESRWRSSLSERDMLIQPYLSSVEGEGERALVWIDGEFTHAVRKTPRFADDAEQVSAALPISIEEHTLAESALNVVSSEASLLYARVDIARDGQGQWRVMELELIEPSLFLAQHPPALQRLVAGVAQRLELIQAR